MNLNAALATLAASQPAPPSTVAQEVAPEAEGEVIVVTATREPVPVDEAPASLFVIDTDRIRNLGLSVVPDLVRLTPGVSVAVNGAPGSLTQVRIRGAEANHTLLFVDGIAFNDPASGNQARFETLAAEGLGQIEILRGPQSALWGSEALGGVIALSSPDPLGGDRLAATAEYGSLDSRRAAVAFVTGSATSGISATASYLEGDGIDIFGGGNGDLDGFRNITAGVKAVTRPGRETELGIAARYISADSEFDGNPPPFYTRADTANASRAETAAVRGWAQIGLGSGASWSTRLEGQYLRSVNRNSDAGVPTNDTIGDRFRVGAQLVRRIDVAGSRHELIGALEREGESFANVDLIGGGASDSSNMRGRTAFVGEWRAWWREWLSTDVAYRHDAFNRFADADTLRASLLLRLSPRLTIHAAYGEGIAQPSFADLYGFSPESAFVSNPDLQPETSRGYEAGIRWHGERVVVQATAFSNDMENEIVEDFATLPFPAYTVVNTPSSSRRRGVELSAEVRPLPELSLSANYTYLDARERDGGGRAGLKEIRRATHSANFTTEWEHGPLSLGASAAYVGARRDTDFDIFEDVTLDAYLLGSMRIAYRLTQQVEAYARMENAFDANYRDVVGYNRPGRTIYAGLRLRLGN